MEALIAFVLQDHSRNHRGYLGHDQMALVVVWVAHFAVA